MTRVVKGIFSDAELDTGFFLTDAEVDIVSGWLDKYANALEKHWQKKGAEGEPGKQEFAKVRSFKERVMFYRGGKG